MTPELIIAIIALVMSVISLIWTLVNNRHNF